MTEEDKILEPDTPETNLEKETEVDMDLEREVDTVTAEDLTDLTAGLPIAPGGQGLQLPEEAEGGGLLHLAGTTLQLHLRGLLRGTTPRTG